MHSDWAGWSSGAHKFILANAGVCTSFGLLLAFICIETVLWEIPIQIELAARGMTLKRLINGERVRQG